MRRVSGSSPLLSTSTESSGSKLYLGVCERVYDETPTRLMPCRCLSFIPRPFADFAHQIIHIITSPADENFGRRRSDPQRDKSHPRHDKQIRSGGEAQAHRCPPGERSPGNDLSSAAVWVGIRSFPPSCPGWQGRRGSGCVRHLLPPVKNAQKNENYLLTNCISWCMIVKRFSRNRSCLHL